VWRRIVRTVVNRVAVESWKEGSFKIITYEKITRTIQPNKNALLAQIPGTSSHGVERCIRDCNHRAHFTPAQLIELLSSTYLPVDRKIQFVTTDCSKMVVGAALTIFGVSSSTIIQQHIATRS
jgi:hypothetical protein